MNSTSTIAHQKTEQTENIESRIIEAAKQEFIKKGFEQTSMSDIAAVVGINRPTLHYYFRTKDKMFQAVFASIVAKFLPHIDTIFSTQQSFSEKLEDVIDVYVSIFSTNPLLPKFIIGEIQRDANHLIETFYSLNLDQYLKHIGEFLEKENRIYELAAEVKGLLVGSVTIAAYSSISTHWLPEVIRDFEQDYPQIENGVGMLRMFETDLEYAVEDLPMEETPSRRICIATGTSVAPFLRELANKHAPRGTTVEVRPIVNKFFGESVTVTGLITGQDLVAQCQDVQADEILIVRSMIRAEGDLFLDNMSVDEVRAKLPCPLKITENSGEGFWRAISGQL